MPSPRFLSVEDCALRVAKEILLGLGHRKPTEEEVEAIAVPIVREFDELEDAIDRRVVRERADLLWARAEELFVVSDQAVAAGTALVFSLLARKAREGEPVIVGPTRKGWLERLRRRFRKEPEEPEKPEPIEEAIARELVTISSNWRESIGAPAHPIDD
jgi:hypothetical protein